MPSDVFLFKRIECSCSIQSIPSLRLFEEGRIIDSSLIQSKEIILVIPVEFPVVGRISICLLCNLKMFIIEEIKILVLVGNSRWINRRLAIYHDITSILWLVHRIYLVIAYIFGAVRFFH